MAGNYQPGNTRYALAEGAVLQQYFNLRFADTKKQNSR